nr:MAG TPA: hypothetical protein [Caudoviricetes sp.]
MPFLLTFLSDSAFSYGFQNVTVHHLVQFFEGKLNIFPLTNI